MTTRQAYEEAELRLAGVEAQIDAIRKWCATPEHSSPRTPMPPGDLQELLLERERLQEESFRIFQQLRAEGGR